jgi:hypothetical protein
MRTEAETRKARDWRRARAVEGRSALESEMGLWGEDDMLGQRRRNGRCNTSGNWWV